MDISGGLCLSSLVIAIELHNSPRLTSASITQEATILEDSEFQPANSIRQITGFPRASGISHQIGRQSSESAKDAELYAPIFEPGDGCAKMEPTPLGFATALSDIHEQLAEMRSLLSNNRDPF